MPTEQEIAKIIAMHEDHKSQREIAKEFDKSVGWVNGILKTLNVKTERSGTKNATEAKKTYGREKRLALNDMFFEKIETMLKDANDPNVVRTLAIPYGVACDKRAALEPNEGSKTGLEEMREAIRKERNVLATSSGKLQSG